MRALLPLLRKESEALMPYWVAFALLCAFNLLAALWEERFVLEPLGDRFSAGSDNATIVWILSFLVGHGAVAHELRDGHVEFLDALPISRAQVYLAKATAALLPVLMLVGASLAMDLLLCVLAEPYSARSPLQPAIVMHLVMLASGLAGLGIGALLSWLGPLAFGVLGLTLLTALCAGVLFPPVYGWLPIIGSFGDLQWSGVNASHPATSPLCHALSGMLALVASGALFLGPGRLLTDRSSEAVAWVRRGAVGCLFLLVLPLGCLSSCMAFDEHAGELWAGKRSIASAEGGFRILYAPGHEERAREVAERVDGISRAIARIVGDDVQHPSPWLDVELLGAPENHLGVFTGGKIRLATDASDAVLAHELAHAHAYSVSGPSAWYQSGSIHFFEEGLADYAEATFTGRDPVTEIAGAVADSGQARFEDLVDRQRHLERHDIRQSYELGAAFAAALAEVGGPGALPCVLDALGEVGTEPVAGLALWYGLAARCEIHLDRVLDEWSEDLRRARQRIDGPLPRLRASVVREGGVRVEVRDEEELGFPLVCGFRDGPEAEPERWIYMRAVGGACLMPPLGLSGHSVQYQVGYLLPGSEERSLSGVYLEWTPIGR